MKKKNQKKRTKPSVVGVDFDGTLCQLFRRGVPYTPKTVIREKPNQTVVEGCRRLHRAGVRVVVYSSRWWGDFHWIKQWLDRHKVPYDDIVLGKFKADAFLDDTTVNPSLDPLWERRLETILGPFSRRRN